MNLAHLICAHLTGDFLLQNHWMQRKTESSWVCTVHVAFYLIPFLFMRLGLWVLLAIAVEHWLQDRFGLARRWMVVYRQTPPELWPVGPLCMDQAMHIWFIWLVSMIFL